LRGRPYFAQAHGEIAEKFLFFLHGQAIHGLFDFLNRTHKNILVFPSGASTGGLEAGGVLKLEPDASASLAGGSERQGEALVDQ
jgi:hypothetical protein